MNANPNFTHCGETETPEVDIEALIRAWREEGSMAGMELVGQASVPA